MIELTDVIIFYLCGEWFMIGWFVLILIYLTRGRTLE